ncbi:MAG: acetylglutamate kinase [Xanthomonadaceae bacterium]|nr:acetylglutamate kinase [Xanthomonadaceae bacterium]
MVSAQSSSYASLRSVARYVRQFRNKVFVVKLGGEVLSDPGIRRGVCEQLALLASFSMRIIVVHGGGNGLDSICASLDIPVEKRDGRRVTSPQVLDVAKMVFAGSVHMDLLAELRAAGMACVGLTGVDAGLLHATRRPPVALPDGGSTDFGLVGDITTVDPAILSHLLAGGYTPVVAPLSGDDDGAVYNTNADTIAAALAGAVGAEKLFFMLKVPGVLRDVSNPSTLVPYATVADLDAMVADGSLAGGMLPKFAAIRAALAGGVRSAHLVSGLTADALLAEVFTNEGSGTMVVAEGRA